MKNEKFSELEYNLLYETSYGEPLSGLLAGCIYDYKQDEIIKALASLVNKGYVVFEEEDSVHTNKSILKIFEEYIRKRKEGKEDLAEFPPKCVEEYFFDITEKGKTQLKKEDVKKIEEFYSK